MTENLSIFKPDWISPPGDTMTNLLEEKGWTQIEFAERTGYTPKHISLLINGKASITEDTAFRLERVLGGSAHFWLNREAQYREAIARKEENESLKNNVNWLKDLPLTDMIRFGWIRKMQDEGEQVEECLRFFDLASVSLWQTSKYKTPLAAFRASRIYRKHASSVGVWMRLGELQASNIDTAPFNKTIFRNALIDIRKLTTDTDPSIFIPRLKTLCSMAGVAVVVAPAPKGCPASGATKFLTPEKALLLLSFRHKSNDHFWFSFYHEAGHILLHGKRMQFLELDEGLTGNDELEADSFARNILIPPHHAARLASLPQTKAAVTEFASKIGVAPGIVIGRMQKDGILSWNQLNGLKVRYKWDFED